MRQGTAEGAGRSRATPLPGDASLFLDSDGRVTAWSASASALTGVSSAKALGRPLRDFCPDFDVEAVLAAAAEHGYAEISGRCAHEGGGVRPVRATISPSTDNSGSLIGYAVILVGGEPALRRLFAPRGVEADVPDDKAVAGASAAALLIDPVERAVLDASPAALAVLGSETGELVGKAIDEVLPEDDATERGDRPGQGRPPGIIHLAGPGGAARAFEVSVLEVVSEGRDSLLYILSDVTRWLEEKSELTRANLELSHLARHDHLTGLFNKPMFLDTLELANSRLERINGLLGVLYIDLDGFKPVNDRYGHDVGDKVLVEVGRRLRQAVRTSDVMARLGGDEFGAILENLKAPRDALKVADLLIRVLGEPLAVDGRSLSLSASIGAVVTNRRAPDSAALLTRADRVMYEAKRRGRGGTALDYVGDTAALDDALN